jgi:hypothetical protein
MEKTFAIIENGVVVNVVVGDSLANIKSLLKVDCVEYTEANPAGIGWSYDGTVFTAPVVEPVVVPTE